MNKEKKEKWLVSSTVSISAAAIIRTAVCACSAAVTYAVDIAGLSSLLSL